MVRNTESHFMQDDDYYKSYADEMNAAERGHENRDYNLALSGVKAGQQTRFIPEENSPTAVQKKKDDEYTALFALMRSLMDDATYAYYTETMEMLTDAENAADNALTYFAMKCVESQQSLDELLAGTTQLHGHGTVFKDANGNVRLADDSIITDPVLLDSIIWKDDAPTYEEYVEKRDDVARYNKSYEAVYTYRTETLGEARETMEDKDNVVTQDGMENVRHNIENQPEELSSFLNAQSPVPATFDASFKNIIDTPKIIIP